MKNTNFSYFYHGGFLPSFAACTNGTNYKGATKNQPLVRTILYISH